ncbi:MAG TPA: hypothetical protein PLP61_15365 [Nocardioides sp.]|uniref:hypothetical protein n=1 Tax=Nocardioides sp. TaxID=35761 RepID=UPI002B9BB1F1|nr:hypothetical protein [Nocardioides sp.]HQR28421.1 hypothetical protein [Nocardioides sp.]
MTGRRVRPGRWTSLLVGLLLAVAGLSLSPAAPAHAAAEGYLDVTVQGPTGSPLSGATVILYPANQPLPDPVHDPDWRPLELGRMASGVDGVAHFVRDDVPLNVNVWVERPGYFGEWYNGAVNYANANDLSISDGLTNTAVVALAQKLRSVHVYVYDADTEADVVGATVGLYAATGGGTTPSATQLTDAAGYARFRIATADTGGLPTGLYKVRAARTGYVTQWYTSGVNDFGNALAVDLTAESSAASIDIAMTAGTPVAFTTAPKPTISGTLRKGRTLTAKPGTWVPKPGALAYRWYRGAKAISGANAKTYTLRKADVGKRISVTVKASLAGYVTTARTSAKTAAIKP